jgi:hypothetical protein
MPMSPPDRPATVWSSTFIPSKSPLPGFGAEGYSVAWVDSGTERLQVVVDGARPSPGMTGRLVNRTFDDQTVEMFMADDR